jgi:hypothetical protein
VLPPPHCRLHRSPQGKRQTRRRPNALRDVTQQGVACVMAQRIVDRLESIKIDDQCGKWRPFTLGAANRT